MIEFIFYDCIKRIKYKYMFRIFYPAVNKILVVYYNEHFEDHEW